MAQQIEIGTTSRYIYMFLKATANSQRGMIVRYPISSPYTHNRETYSNHRQPWQHYVSMSELVWFTFDEAKLEIATILLGDEETND